MDFKESFMESKKMRIKSSWMNEQQRTATQNSEQQRT